MVRAFLRRNAFLRRDTFFSAVCRGNTKCRTAATAASADVDARINPMPNSG